MCETSKNNKFSLIWLDNSINKSEENLQAQKKLQNIINHLILFEDYSQCLQYIESLSSDNQIILIVNGKLGQILVPQISYLEQIISIYIYCIDKKTNELWAKQYHKIKGIFVRLEELIDRIHFEKQQIRINEILSISIFKSNISNEGESTSGLNGKFIRFQLLIDCLIRMKSDLNDRNEFIFLCKEEYKTNSFELKIIEEFEKNYKSEKSLWWYTRESFLYRLLNKSFRVQNIDLLYLFKFFIHDIKQELEKNKCLLSIQVYRGQIISKEEIENLKINIGEFISINSFLSTSLNRQQALSFLSFSNCSDGFERVLFQINANPQLNNIKPFSNITKLSYFPQEDEILFMIGSIFRLINIKKDDQGIWIIDMILCSDDDSELKSVFDYMKNKFGQGQTTLLAFGRLLAEMGKLDHAEKYFHRLLKQLSDNHQDISACYHGLGNVAQEKGNYQESLQWFNKTLTIGIQFLGLNHPNIANTYNSIGIVYSKLNDSINAMQFYRKALEIYLKTYDEDHPDVAMCLLNIGGIYEKEKMYKEALESNKKALIIWKKYLPNNHPNLVHSHSCIAIIYRSLQQYDLALEYFNLALEIAKKSFPSQHTEIAKILESIGLVYEFQDKFQQALSFYEQSSKMFHQLLSSNHPDLIRIEQHIQRIHLKI